MKISQKLSRSSNVHNFQPQQNPLITPKIKIQIEEIKLYLSQLPFSNMIKRQATTIKLYYLKQTN